MMHVLVVSLLVPLALLFSINVKALDVENNYGFLDNGVLETPLEVSNTEANPDLDHPLITVFGKTVRRRFGHARDLENVRNTLAHYEVTSCRDPPKYG